MNIRFIKIDFKFLVMIVFNLVLTGVSILFPMIIMKITDSLTQNNIESFNKYLIYAFITVILQVLFFYISGRMSNKYVKYRLIEIRKLIVNELLEMPYDKFRRKKLEEYTSLLLTNVQTLEDDYYMSFINVISKSILLIGSIIAIASLNMMILISLIIMILTLCIVPLIFSKKILKYKEEYISNTEKYTKISTDSLNGIEIIKAYNIKEAVLNRYIMFLKSLEKSKYNIKNVMLAANTVLASSTFIVTLLIFMLGGYFVNRGVFTIGALMACMQLTMHIIEPGVTIAEEINNIKSTKPIRNRIIELTIKSEDSVDFYNETDKLKEVDDLACITLNNVEYRYNENEEKVLSNINLVFSKGKRYAIVGNNGSGKSTLLKIIGKIITGYSGEVYINRDNYRDVNIISIGFVDQSNFMFDMSIIENIKLFRNYEDDEELQKVIEILNLTDLVNPESEKNIKNYSGKNLSGGEKQKISIARALLKNPNILLIDEGDSALDSDSIQKINEIISNRKDIICIVVTHKIDSSLKIYDEIIVLDKGKVIKQGSYEEVII